jgi:Xaa-Pro aminopeptidase
MGWFSCSGTAAYECYKDADIVDLDAQEKLYPSAIDTSERLAKLRGLLIEHKLDNYLIPSSDAHGSEYVADKDRRQRYISGFTGESSMAIVSRDEAALFVDGRYHDSAGKEIDSNWTLYKVGLQGVPTWQSYVKVSARQS